MNLCHSWLNGPAIPIAKTSQDSDQDSESSLSASSDSDDTDATFPKGAESGSPNVSRRVSKISIVTKHVSEQTKALYETSALLRRPVVRNKYLRSNRPDDSEDPSTQLHKIMDERHIQEKISQWIRNWKAANNDETTDFDQTSTELLQTRLAGASLKRRKQLQYWLEHSERVQTVSVVQHPLSETPVATQPKLRVGEKALVSRPDIQPVGPGTAPLGVTKVTFFTVAVTEKHDAPSEAVPRTIYAESKVGKTHSVRVPFMSHEKGLIFSFPCSYCGSILQTKQMRNRRTWK